MPRAWMSKIRYLAPEQDKDSDDDGDNDGCLSSRLAETGPETGSWAIVLRCPALGEDSAQAVRLVPWDNWSIGVHPELCAPLHLDFDGDEVHVFMTSDTASMAEIRARASRARYSKFTEPVVRAAMDWCDDIAPEDVVHGTFIRSSTMTLESLLNDPVPHPVHRLGRCKVELWPVLKDRYLAEDKPIRFVEQCSLAMSNVIASQLSVSDGYMVTRQSKYLGSQLVSTRTGLHMPCWYGPGSEAIEAIDSDVVPTGTHHGSPAMRVLARLSAKAMQGSLDKAKHRSTQAMSVSPASSLITGQDRALCIVNDPVAGHLMRVLRSDAAGDVLARVIATSSVKIVSEAIARGMTLNKTWSLCLSSAVMILHEEQIQGDEHETVALAAVIMALARSGVDSPMALPGRSRVLSELGCNWLVCCLNEDLSAIRRLRTAGAETFADAHPIADPATAFVFGNFSACACVQCTISAIGKAIVNVSVDPARLQNVIVPVPVSNQSVDAIDVQIEAYLPMTWHLSLCLFSSQAMVDSPRATVQQPQVRYVDRAMPEDMAKSSTEAMSRLRAIVTAAMTGSVYVPGDLMLSACALIGNYLALSERDLLLLSMHERLYQLVTCDHWNLCSVSHSAYDPRTSPLSPVFTGGLNLSAGKSQAHGASLTACCMFWRNLTAPDDQATYLEQRTQLTSLATMMHMTGPSLHVLGMPYEDDHAVVTGAWPMCVAMLPLLESDSHPGAWYTSSYLLPRDTGPQPSIVFQPSRPGSYNRPRHQAVVNGYVRALRHQRSGPRCKCCLADALVLFSILNPALANSTPAKVAQAVTTYLCQDKALGPDPVPAGVLEL
ncbi:unnamed protein product [Closterium sp. NIES-65]|nr:unnamed protein product [Closterium sp. NIES-65]